jgi:galactokinase
VSTASSDAAARSAREFERLVGRPPAGVWSAPGRVNLIGEHLDYNGGTVVPVAIGLRTRVAAAPRDDGRLRCWSLQRDGSWEGTVDEARYADGWAAYAAGTVWALAAAGLGSGGVDLVADGDVPLGAGLSSSAALECAVASAVTEIAGRRADPMALARAGQRAEREIAGAPVGLMDQVAALYGRPGQAVVFDTAGERVRHVDLPLARTGTSLLVIDTGSSHDLASGGYAQRRRECEQAAQLLGVDRLASATRGAVEAIGDETLRRRARHVVGEQARVEAALDRIRAADMPALGRLLSESHASLRDDFDVSVPQLDGAVDAAAAAGAFGARLTGGGFGGCVVVLVATALAGAVRDRVSAAAAGRGWPTPAFHDGAPQRGAGRDR